MSNTSITRSSTGAVGNYAAGQTSNQAPRAPWRDWLALALLMFPVLLVAVDNTALMPSANLLYGIPMLGGYDSMELATTADLVQLLSNDERGAYFIKEIRQFDRTEALPLARLLGVRYVLSPIELPPPYELRLDGPTKVYEDSGVLPRAFWASRMQLVEDPSERLELLGSPDFDPYLAILEELPSVDAFLDADAESWRAKLATSEVVHTTPTDVEVLARGDLEVRLVVDTLVGSFNSDQPGLVVLTDAWDAGWKAELRTDGIGGESRTREVPVLRVHHGLRGVLVPPGRHELVLRYEPGGLRSGLLLGLVGLLGILACLAPFRRVRA